MKSVFDTIRESRGKPLRTRPLSDVADVPGRIRQLARAAAIIRTHFLDNKGWRFRYHDGSLTFQYVRKPHRVIKMLVDHDNVLAEKAGLLMHRDPIVIGVELTYENPFVRERVRDFLLSTFGDYYLDPRAPRGDSLEVVTNDKYWIAPHNDHFYDVVFLPPGDAISLTARPEVVDQFEKRIMSALKARGRSGRDA
jgi:hypothetical protein